MLARLQQIGAMRRSKDPEFELVSELFTSLAARFACAGCGGLGLSVREATDDSWDDWETSRACQSCGKPIPKERLDVFPDTKVCAVCQQEGEAGGDEEPEFCPRCGEVMKLRLDSRGTSRYVMSCPKCGSGR